MMKIKYYFVCFFILLSNIVLVGQCGLTGATIIINELGNTSAGNNGEFIELVVVASSQAPFENIDLSNWIIDDNNASDVYLGNEPGHIRLSGSCFSAIPPGSIILLYNPDVSIEGIDTHSDGMPNEIGVYQVPITSPCIEKHNGCPDHVNSSYGCPVDESSHSTFEYESVWNNYIPMRNKGDGIQIRNAYAEVVSAIYWEVPFFPAGGIRIEVPDGTVSLKSIQFIGRNNWLTAEQYIVSDTGSPGFPNSDDNEALINALQNGEANPTVLDVAFFEMNPSAGEPLNNGAIAIDIVEGMEPFEITYSGVEMDGMFTSNCSGYLLIPNLVSGLYFIQVTDALGCVKYGSVNISEDAQTVYECPDFSSNECELEDFFSREYANIDFTCEQWIGDFCSTESNIHRFGKLGIGTNQINSGYQLAVKGGLLSDEIYVELCSTRGWCDYVFDDDYSIMAIDSLKEYVFKEYHLPGMISQSEIEEEGGLELKKISLQQQEKIEELFLYLIDANEKIQKLKERVASIELENNRIKAKK